MFKKFQSCCCVTAKLQEMSWRSDAGPPFPFFRTLPPVRSGFSHQSGEISEVSRSFCVGQNCCQYRAGALLPEGWYWALPHSSMWCPLPLLSYAPRKGNCRAVQEVTRIFLVSQEVLICSTSWFHLFHRWRNTWFNVWEQRSWEDHFNYTCVTTKDRCLS